MNKIDLHIHTIPTVSDSHFIFSIETFQRYVAEMKLHAVAVTNHDVFDSAQYAEIKEGLKIPVFPGIEVNVEKGHVLIITEASDIADFDAKGKLVSKRISKVGDTMTLAELKSIFGKLDKYLVIPHYDKAPPIMGDALEQLMPHVSAGEVDSPKKFIRAIRNESKLTPVLFSDARMREGLETFPTRQTYIDCGDMNLSALKACLRDKSKVALSESEGNRLWQVFDNGQMLSTGLNILLGARSSGKTHTLDAIHETIDGVKYIRQFALVQKDEAADEREFVGEVERKRSMVVDNHLTGLKRVIEGVADINLQANDKKVAEYADTLVRAAVETDRRDAFSKATLFDEVPFPLPKTDTLQQLIGSVRQLIENVHYRAVIAKHVDIQALKDLICELIETLWQKTLENRTAELVNELMKDVKAGLKLQTAATQTADVDLYEVLMDVKRVERFEEIVGFLKRESVVFEETIQGFRIVARRQPYRGAGEIKEASGTKTAFSDAYARYGNPYEYLQILLANDKLARDSIHKLFVKITCRILNKDGFEVSGGERSEFRLLQEIKDAQNFDVLLIDEPESSFDNLFLKSDVNQLLKSIADSMPVVVVTHNSTVGASVGGDYLLYTTKEVEGGEVVYRLYSGFPTDKVLRSVNGRVIGSHGAVLDSLEAGATTYENRRRGYEAIKS